MTKTELANDYVAKYIELGRKKGVAYSKRSIATILWEENKDMFDNVEDARLFVRRILGSAGIKSIKDKYAYIREQFGLMDEAVVELRDVTPFIFPRKKPLVLNDIHGLFRDDKALEVAINHGIKHGCDSVFINGDFLDFYRESKFDKDPKIARMMDEREWGIDFLKLMQDVFGHVVLKEGNHDKRRMEYLNRKFSDNPSYMDILGATKDYLFFDGCRVDFVEDYRVVKLGKLNALHGHEYGGFGGGINVARNRFLKTLENTISGHSHIAKSDLFKSVSGEIYGSWTVACLCNLNPRYAGLNNWQHGFATVDIFDNGDFEVNNKIIYNGKSFNA